ncbi:disease resistance protein [Musa troglodytarum]|uniref:Disease resistance protein n=1 Tax=Musa troglodytarum TaxID=320322 RepID=A0A9E7FQW5_9LILI|nr:disease resistance protein [Musa troglodytarum]
MPADALLLSLLQQLIVWLVKDAFRQVAAARGGERELERLERALPGIQAMLADAEEKRSSNPAVKQWLAALKDVAYDAEAVIDELNTQSRFYR